jgi:hypothetical protein
VVCCIRARDQGFGVKSLDLGGLYVNDGRSSPMVSPKRFEMARIVCHRARFKFAAVFMIGATALFTRGVSGYVFEGPKWLSSPVIQLSLGNAGEVLSDGNTSWNNAAAPALDMWNQVIRRIQLGRVLNSGIQPAQRDGINSMAFSNRVFGHTWPPSAYAVTHRLAFWIHDHRSGCLVQQHKDLEFLPRSASV